MRPIAVVTGASSGIGGAYARQLAAQGFDVLATGRRAERLEALREELAAHGSTVTPVVVELGDPAAVAALADRVAATDVELLVNNAGLAHYRPFVDLGRGLSRELVEVNVQAPLTLASAVLPGMVSRGHGAVVNVASLLAFSGASGGGAGMPPRVVYAGTKALLVTATRVLASELEGTGVRVQVVCPGVVATDFHTRQGIDLSAVPRMDPDLVARASLADLERGVVVSVPGLDDVTALERLDAAAAELTAAARATELPERYG
jgi:short-subunit dehydrogenase